MAARHDILDEREPFRNPLLRSIALHGAVFASVAVYGMLPGSQRVRWGDPNSLGGGAVAITPVSKIPIPSRSGRPNPVANDTPSRVPAPPRRQQAKPAPKEDPAAVAIKSRQSTKARQPQRSASRAASRPQPEPSNQLYSSAGAAVSSPMFGSTSGSGGVGLGRGDPFGERFGYYTQLLRQLVASKWDTTQVDPRLQTAPPVIVTFEILRGGGTQRLRFLQRSGNSTLDYSAQRAIVDASPFPPLPAGFERDSAVIEFWFHLQR